MNCDFAIAMETLPQKTVQWDLSQINPQQCYRLLQEWCQSATPAEGELLQAKGQDWIGGNLSGNIKLKIHGSLGDFCLACIAGAAVEVSGDVGLAAATSMRSGSILITGKASGALAAYASGGFIGVLGSAGARCGVGLQGADIVLRGNVGPQVGYRAKSGTIVIGGDAGSDLGAGMTGGTIFIRGQCEKIADHLASVKMKDADRMRVSILMLNAGIKASGKEFRKYQVAAQGEPL